MQAMPPVPLPLELTFLRHGATQANLDGLRCGGDLDLPLTDLGRRQVATAAQRLREQGARPGLIVTSALQRTRESAAIIAAALPGLEILVEPCFAERRLGGWNLRPIADTEPWLAQKITPPGGESDQAFLQRVDSGLGRLLPHFKRRPLLVGSKGVARALRVLLDLPRRPVLGNAEADCFDVSAYVQEAARRASLETAA